MALGPCAADTARCERRHKQPGLCSELQSAANGSPQRAQTEHARDCDPLPSECGWRAQRGASRRRSWPAKFEHGGEVERSANPGGEVRIQNRIESRAQRDVHSLRLTGNPEVITSSVGLVWRSADVARNDSRDQSGSELYRPPVPLESMAS